MSFEKPVIKVTDISKCFYTYAKPSDRLKQALVPKFQRAFGAEPTLYGKEYWALRNISFEVAKGETVGIVGRNGSGKSTLLQIICGTLTPTSGTIETQGRVAALLELGSGFNPEFTGRENVYLNAAVLGLNKQEVDDRFDSIAGFADIGDFIDQPVKNYSSGMAVRLAFAVQAQVDPDILVVDEALSVGDAKFQAKCFERLRQLKNNGTSILLVTHSPDQVVTHCNRAVLLENSRVELAGKSRVVVNRYLDILFGRDGSRGSGKTVEPISDADRTIISGNLDGLTLSTDSDVFAKRVGYNAHEYRWGDGAAVILDFHVSSANDEYPAYIEPGTEIVFHFTVIFKKNVPSPVFGFTIKTKEGVNVYSTNSIIQSVDLSSVGGTDTVALVKVAFVNRLAAGDYFLSVGVASVRGEDVIPHDRRYDSIHFMVLPTPKMLGLVDLSATMGISSLSL